MSSQTTENVTCRQVEPLLDDLVDGQLSRAARDGVRRHLAACESCTAHLASLEDLLERAAALPRAVEPPGDLWPGIAPRLAGRGSRRRAFGLRQAVAALLLMALGGLLSQVLWPGAATPEAADLRSASLAAIDRQADFALAEADYLRAKEVLWAAIFHAPPAESPETREVVERNLRIIDRAIEELRQALAADPGNPQLESLLLAQHRTEIGLLQRLRRATVET